MVGRHPVDTLKAESAADTEVASALLNSPLVLWAKPHQRVWGGRQIAELFGRSLPDGEIGESWEIHGDLAVAEGPLTGRTLDSLVTSYGAALLGRLGAHQTTFPLLTKWLDCRDWLSIQVHPDDRLARELSGQPEAKGKSEAWYVVRRSREAKLIHGLRDGVEPKDVVGVGDSSLLNMVRELSPDEGTLIFTGAGTVHALGPGFLIYEIQQSSDLTYRLYDWGRDRPVHLVESARCVMEVVSPDFQQDKSRLCCPYFVVEELSQSQSWALTGESLQILVAVEGSCELRGAFGIHRMAFGDTVLLPAGMGELNAELEGAAGRLLRIGLAVKER